MAPRGHGQLGLQLAGEGLGAGENFAPVGGFKGLRFPLTGLFAPPVRPARAARRACEALSHALGANARIEGGRARGVHRVFVWLLSCGRPVVTGW
jgi:hypothetical protein